MTPRTGFSKSLWGDVERNESESGKGKGTGKTWRESFIGGVKIVEKREWKGGKKTEEGKESTKRDRGR